MQVHTRLEHPGLPADVQVLAIDAVERLSTLFAVQVEVATADADVELPDLLNTPACIVLRSDVGEHERTFHGAVERADFIGLAGRAGQQEERARYRLTLRPWLAGLAHRVRSRIFQEQHSIAIIERVLVDGGVPADQTRWDTGVEPPTRVYCTQWKESELAFVLRLLEEDGIFFGFEHSETDHVLWFADDASVWQPIDGDPVLAPVRLHEQREGLWSPVLEDRLVHDAVRARDFFADTPDRPLSTEAGGGFTRTHYEYPGGFADAGEGEYRSAMRLEEAWANERLLRAGTNCLRLSPGRTFDIATGETDVFLGQYVVREVRHRYRAAGGSARYPGATAGEYANDLEAAPADVPFRPPRITPRPVARGLESAVVTGPPGEEIHVDELGRVKVHFAWDRENPVDDTASCWIRVQQLNTQGAMILPRVGWELHVAFENGDPDRPIALHKAYNQETMPPYGLPANKTQSALQSSTSPGGGATNEIRLQDGNGGMQWFLHASRDLSVTVAHDEEETIGIDAEETVTGTMDTHVGGDETGTVGSNQTVDVVGSAAHETTANQAVTVGANDDWGIIGNYAINTVGDRTEDISGLMNVLANTVTESIGGNYSRTVGAAQAITSGSAIAETVGASKTETVAAAKTIVTPGEYAESATSAKTLTSGAVTMKAGGDVTYGARGAIAITAAGGIEITADEDAMFTGDRVQITAGSATIKGGGGTFKLGGSITIDAKKFGGAGGPMLTLKGKTDYRS